MGGKKPEQVVLQVGGQEMVRGKRKEKCPEVGQENVFIIYLLLSGSCTSREAAIESRPAFSWYYGPPRVTFKKCERRRSLVVTQWGTC